MKLQLPSGNATPNVELDTSLLSQTFKGISIPIDAVKFYQPILEFISDNQAEFLDNTCFVFEFEYYNTSSSKVILNLLKSILKIKEENKRNWTIQWLYGDEDDFMYDAGTDLEALLQIPILTAKTQ